MINIIIPTYRARETLPQALDSLVSQTKRMFITTIVQDCDNEDYSDIIQEYTRRGLKIRLIKMNENVGPGLARQAGMDSDTMCDYCMFMDSDDMLMPRAIEVLYTEAKKRNADVIMSDFYAERFHQPGTYLACDEVPVTWCHGKIYKLKYLRDNHIRFIPELRLNEDSYFNLVAVNCAERKFRIKELTYLWRANQNSLTRAKGTTEFFKQSWSQYVNSQIQAIYKISDIMGSMRVDVLAMTLINIYDHCMKAIYLGYKLDNLNLNRLGYYNVIQNAVNNEEFWKIINEKLKGSVMFDDCLIFYKLRFCDWLNQYILGV